MGVDFSVRGGKAGRLGFVGSSAPPPSICAGPNLAHAGGPIPARCAWFTDGSSSCSGLRGAPPADGTGKSISGIAIADGAFRESDVESLVTCVRVPSGGVYALDV